MAIYKLGDCFEIISGKKHLTNNGSIPVVGSGGIFGGTSDKPSYYKYTFSLPRKGSMSIFQYNLPIFNADTAFLVGNRKNNNSIKKYLYYYLLDKTKWSKIINGTTRPATKISDWKKLKINLPSLKTQKQIIDIIEPIEKLELTIKKLSKVIGFITKNTFITFSEKNDYNFQKGLLPIKNKVGITPFLNVSAANNKINRYVINEPNIKIGDVTISLDGNTGLVNNALEGFNGYLFKVTSKKWKNYQIYYSLKNKINQKIIKLNEIGTTIKHSSKSKKEILHLEFLEDFLLKEMFNLEISIFKIVKKLKKLKKFLINLLIN